MPIDHAVAEQHREEQGQPSSAKWDAKLRKLLLAQIVIGTIVFVASVYALVVIRPLFLEHDTLHKEVEKLQDDTTRLSKEKSRLSSDTLILVSRIASLSGQSASLEEELRKWVQRDVIPVAYIEYATGFDTTSLHGLRATLRASWIAAAGGQPVGPPPHSKVVYYFPDDLADARRVAQLTQEYYDHLQCSKGPITPERENGVRHGAMEIWLTAGCNNATQSERQGRTR
jgi:cell division protein FtsL